MHLTTNRVIGNQTRVYRFSSRHYNTDCYFTSFVVKAEVLLGMVTPGMGLRGVTLLRSKNR